MAGSWREVTLADVVSLQRGHDLTEAERRPGRVPVYGSAGHNGFHDTVRSKGPGIVIGRSGASFGKVHFSPTDYWPHNTALYVTDFKGNDARFVYYLLNEIDFTAFNSGSAQPSLNRNYIANIKVTLPELDEQERIAAAVGAFDDRITLLRDTNRTLEDMARLLFRGWFVDFEPVRAKMEGRAPTSCDAATAALFPDRLVESELGEVPEGWEVKGLDEIADFLNGLALQKYPPKPGDRAVFYDTLKGGYDAQRGALQTHLAEVAEYLDALESALTEKRSKPFERISLETRLAGRTVPAAADGASALKAINQLIGQHNDQTNNFQVAVTDARKKLEDCLVAESIASYKEKCEAVDAAANAADDIRREKADLERSIADLERDIVEHRQPADELNHELRSYLGRDELKFDVKETGYSISRGGVAAADLSEGERTAIALLYFLKSLHDKGFKIEDGVVVIDDPISSLDTNALFAAFGFMKDRTKDAGQLFVLTHNFAFFRQVKNWFRHIPNKKQDVRFYMLEASYVGTGRNACLRALDSLLIDYESEYHYLFDRVYKHSFVSGVVALESHYELPNIARRLLESFLSFRFPSCDPDKLHKQLERTKAPVEARIRIIRFLHTYSHDGKISEPEHDLSVLAETPAVLRDLLALIKLEDPTHYGEMEALVGVLTAPVAPVVVAASAVALTTPAP